MNRTTSESPIEASLGWLVDLGVERTELVKLNPCVPGEFTLPETYYVNTASPRVIYLGTAEGTLPIVPGRWYIIPNGIVQRHTSLTRDTLPVAAAVRRTRG
jgi:hypothetical protein